jgi:hypothetical protein
LLGSCSSGLLWRQAIGKDFELLLRKELASSRGPLEASVRELHDKVAGLSGQLQSVSLRLSEIGGVVGAHGRYASPDEAARTVAANAAPAEGRKAAVARTRKKDKAAAPRNHTANSPAEVYEGLAPWPPGANEVPRFAGVLPEVLPEGNTKNAGGFQNWPIKEDPRLVLMRHDSKGMGVFAVAKIDSGSLVCYCPVDQFREMSAEDQAVESPPQGSQVQADQLYGARTACIV